MTDREIDGPHIVYPVFQEAYTYIMSTKATYIMSTKATYIHVC